MTKPKDAGPHLGLARKYRPAVFAEIAGQEAVSTTLRNALEAGKPGQAYLFFGPRGVGKTTTARILAKGLNCHKGPTPEPCGECASCREIAAGNSTDVLELDAATNTQVERIREMIIETVSLAPSRDRRKIFIIDEVHMLSTSSFNALLKTLEEPPPHVVFILATTDAGKVPATVVSRCQRFRFRPLPPELILERLQELAKAEKIPAEPQALEYLARAAGGSLRDAAGLLEQARAFAEGKLTAEGVRELLGALPEEDVRELASAVLEKDAGALSAVLKRVLEEGTDPAQILRELRRGFHEARLSLLGAGEAEGCWKKLAAGRSPEFFSFLVLRMNRALEELRSCDSPSLSLEIALYATLDSMYDPAEWIARLEALERRLAGDAPAGIGPAAGSAGRESGGCSAPPTENSPPRGGDEFPSPSPGGRATVSSGGDLSSHPAADSAGREPGPSPARPDPDAVARKPSGPAAGPSADPERVWPAVLGRLRELKPGLAQDLEACRLVSGEGPQWRLLFRRPFELERAQNNQGLIEANLSTALGRPARLRLELGSPPRPAPASDGPAGTGRKENDPRREPADSPSEGREEPAGIEDPGVRKVLEIFPGKVREFKKKEKGS